MGNFNDLEDFNLDFSLEDIKIDAEEGSDNDIAIIGMSLRTPCGEDINEFWNKIQEGFDFIGDLPKDREEDVVRYFNFINNKENEKFKYFKGAYLEDIDKFDYKFFNMTPKEAELMDPYQRIFLQNTFKAIEDAGYGGDRLKKTDTGIFVGYGGNMKDSYQKIIFDVDPKAIPLSFVGNMNGFIGSRISYLLDLRGPSMLIDTTCASSLTAVHTACQSLINGECSMAIAGSIRLNIIPVDNDVYRMGVESKDYVTRTFDKNCDGFGIGEGVVSIVLKPLKRAVYDKDSIYAVIKGSSVNQGGNSMALTATNPEAQTEVIKRAWRSSGIEPESIELIEAHGTGTNLGDPIEIKGLTDAFREFTDKKSFCAIGSIKSNLGHLYEASGILGLAKVVMAVRNKVIPASLNLNNPNDEIDFVNSPIYVNTKSRYWDTDYDKRRAAINSFGLNGANCHMVIEEYKEEKNSNIEDNDNEHILLISAKSESALKNLVSQYKKYIENNDINLNNLCYTSAVGRWHYNYRLALSFRSKDELIEKLNSEVSNYSKLSKNFEEKELDKDYSLYTPKELKEYYLKGYKIPWNKVYSDYDYSIVHAPSYEFDKERCWLQIPEICGEEFAFDMKWIEDKCSEKDLDDKKVTLLVSTSLEELNKYEAEFKSKEVRCYKALICEKFDIDNEELFKLTGNIEDFAKLAEKVKDIDRAIYIEDKELFESINNVEEFDDSLKKGLYTIFNLYKSIKLKELVLVTINLNLISKEEEFISKELSMAVSLLKVIDKEDKNIKVRLIDIDSKTTIKEVYDELLISKDLYSALRNNKRYIEVFSKIEIKKDKNINLKNYGCYLITGGTGAISLELCKLLSQKEKITLVLLNRSKFIDRSLWDKTLEENADDKLVRQIKAIKEIEDKGSKVICKSVDICNYDEMEKLITDIENEFGRINGVMHCAGISGYGLIKDIEVSEVNNIINPKAKGIFIIEKILKHKLDFYILLSSVSTFFPSAMQLAYSASNKYLDSFTEYLLNKGQNVLRVNWTTWKEIGMAKEAGIANDFAFKALKTKEAVDLFDKILQDSSVSKALLGYLNRTKLGINILKKSGVSFSDNLNLEISEGNETKETIVYSRSKDVEVTGKTDENYTKIERQIAEICKEVLGYQVINVYENFFEMGADSLQIMNIQNKISQLYPNMLDATDMFSYSNVAKLAEFLSLKLGKKDSNIKEKDIEKIDYEVNDDDFAIIGIAAKLPEVKNLQEFNDFLVQKQCAVSELPKWRKEFLKDYLRFKDLNVGEYKFAQGSYLKDVDKFDYKYFNISPRESALIDPHQRLFLELIHEAIEDAGYGGKKISNSKTGVFLGFASNVRDMYSRLIYDINSKSSGDAIVGNTAAVAAGRISYYLNLKGISMVIDTACSSSMAAIDTAINFMKAGSIKMAVVGGIKLNLVPLYTDDDENQIGMESSDAITRSFDSSSDGTAFGEGVEAIVIKPLSKAVEDGDNIYATIKGIATNQDGNSTGITAPNPQSQKEVILEAWRKAGINPEDLSFVESHGTGTQLGDRIEFRSLSEAFEEYTDKKGFCALGAVKTNIGHLSEGSGLAGLLKGILALKNQVIPPLINFQNPNRLINMINSPLYVNTKPISWPKTEKPRAFALSNFGMSGTNAHIVIEEFMDTRESTESTEKQIITISNRTYEGFMESVDEFIQYLNNNKEINLESLAFTINTGRSHYEYRLAIIDDNVENIIRKLEFFKEENKNSKDIYFGRNKILLDNRKPKKEFELYEEEKRILNDKSRKILDEDKDLNEICKLYVMGADIEWSKLYEGKNIIKVSAPTYKFEKISSWIQVPKVDYVDENCIFYDTKWKPSDNEGTLESLDNKYLVFYDEKDKYSTDLINKLEENSEVIKVPLSYMKEEAEGIEKYKDILINCKEKGVNHIVNMLALGDYREDLSQENNRLYSMFYLIKSMSDINYTSTINMTVITNSVFQVTGKEKKLSPSMSSVIGLNRVIALEMTNVNSKSIDIDKDTDVSRVIDEINNRTVNYMVSLRENIRYVEEFGQNNLIVDNEYKVKDTGVYVLTGGTGGIALVLAKALADRNHKVKIALLNRNELIDDGTEYKKEKIKAIETIRSMGAEVNLFKVDVDDKSKVKGVFDKLKISYGKINGVIHTAGVASAEILITKSKEKFDEVISPKIDGTLNIFNEIKDEQLDFLLLCGSSSVLTGEASQADYVAANTFLNAFTYYANSKGVNTKCINWVSWKSEGMAVRYKINVDTIFKALENKDAIKGFFNIINSSLKCAYIGKLNFDYFKENNINIDNLPFDVNKTLRKSITFSKDNQVELEFNPLKTRKAQAIDEKDMKLSGKGGAAESYSEIEKDVAGIFMKVLGYTSIDIYDNFFELGGDSILLGRVHTLLEEKYPGKFKLVDLFEYTSVNKIAEHITKEDTLEIEESPKEIDEELDFESMLKDLESGELSVDDMIKKLD